MVLAVRTYRRIHTC